MLETFWICILKAMPNLILGETNSEIQNFDAAVHLEIWWASGASWWPFLSWLYNVLINKLIIISSVAISRQIRICSLHFFVIVFDWTANSHVATNRIAIIACIWRWYSLSKWHALWRGKDSKRRDFGNYRKHWPLWNCSAQAVWPC